jgi:hypothetical protein
MTATIYTLSDPRTGAVRYVGKTVDMAARLREHRRAVGRTAKARWVKMLKGLGLSPVLEPLETVPVSKWQEAEVYWITQLKALGIKLLNGDCGGLGSDRLPVEVKQKISASLTGRPNTALARPVAQYNKDGFLVMVFDSYQTAAKAVSGSHSNICRAVIKGKVGAYGFLWRKVDGEPPLRIDTPYVNGAIPLTEETRKRLALLSRERKRGPTPPEVKAKQRAARLRYYARLKAAA